jgi:hypothetical protein
MQSVTGSHTGRGVQYRRLDPALMARVCRECAERMRAEARAGWPDIHLASADRCDTISRKEAAESMDAQGARWALEAETGVLNAVDRAKLGW